MATDDLLAKIQQLSLDEKLVLLDALMRAVRVEIQERPTVDSSLSRVNDLEVFLPEGPPPSFERLCGILATTGLAQPEYYWKDDDTDYLTKKYA